MDMTRLAAVLAALLLALPAATSAKGVTAATICGADGCEEVRDHVALQRLAEGGPPAGRDVPSRDFFRVRFTVSHSQEEIDSIGAVLVPRLGAMRAQDGTWLALTPAARRVARRLTAGREPLPAADMPRGAVAPEPAAAVDAVYRTPATAAPGDGSPWMLAIAAAAALAAGLLAALRPRRPRPRRSPAARPGA